MKRRDFIFALGGAAIACPFATHAQPGKSHRIGYLALRAGCPVVPVVCVGTAEALPKGRRLPRWRSPVTVAFGPAFEVKVDGDARARSTVAAAAEQIRVHLRDHLDAVAGDVAA